MNRQLFPIYLILGYIGFRLLMSVFYPIFVVIHELGHAVPARLAGRKQVRIVMGTSPALLHFSLFGITFDLGSKQLQRGYTTYAKPQSESATALCFIFGMAPLVSLIFVITGICLWRAYVFDTLGYFILGAAWLTNVHIVFSSLWPFELATETDGQESPVGGPFTSDLLNLIRALRKK